MYNNYTRYVQLQEKRRMDKDGDAKGKPINKEPGSEFSRHFTSGKSPSGKNAPNVKRHKEMRGVKKPRPGSSGMDRFLSDSGRRMDNDKTKNRQWKDNQFKQQGRHMKWDNDRRKPKPGTKRPSNERVTRNLDQKTGGQNTRAANAKKRGEGWVSGTLENRKRAVQTDRSKRVGRDRENVKKQLKGLGTPKSNIRKFTRSK